MTDLTPKQEDVYKFIVWHSRTKLRPPTVTEISHHFNYKSDNSGWAHVKALRRKGYLTSNPIEGRRQRIELVSVRKKTRTISNIEAQRRVQALNEHKQLGQEMGDYE